MSHFNLECTADANTKKKAITILGDLARDKKILLDRVPEILNIFIMATTDTDLNIKQNSLRGIIVLIGAYELTKNNITEILESFIINSIDENASIRNAALFGINLLMEKSLLSTENIERALSMFIIGAQSRWLDVQKNSLYAIGEIIKKNKLPPNKLEEVLSLLEAKASNIQHNNASHTSLVIIKKLIERNLIPESKREKILNLLITKINEEKLLFDGISEIEKKEIADIMDGTIVEKLRNICTPTSSSITPQNTSDKGTTMITPENLTNLIQQDNIPIEKIDELLTLLILNAGNKSLSIKVSALTGIVEVIEKSRKQREKSQSQELIIRYEIPENKISEIIDFFTTISNDAEGNIRNIVLCGINLLIKKELLSTKNLTKVLDAFIAENSK
ncbi:MAG: hypothetical protein LRY67_07075 [Gammaproteobacteria bacterium]|nr:hypothetical protein [Gammaproteobacteria bacterium]